MMFFSYLSMDESTNIALKEEVQKPSLAPEKRHSLKTEVLETLRFIFIALIIVIPVRLFIAQPFIVSGASMDPTFKNGQYLIVDELSYLLNDPARGDVVIFKYPKNPKQYFIKRVIGLPGDTITIGDNGAVSIKDTSGTMFLLDEPYIVFKKNDALSRTVGADEYFMMGDNRAGSFDSRMWGPVKREFIIGRALVRLFPLSTLSILPGESRYEGGQ